MHTWLATGLMGRVIRSRRTLALVAVLAVLAFALPVAFAQQGQAAPPTSQVAAAVNPQTGAAAQETAPATPAPEAGGEANLDAAGHEPGHVPERHQRLQAAGHWTDLLRASACSSA